MNLIVMALLFVGFGLTLFLMNNKDGKTVERAPVVTCSDGWRITGYFTPIETDYASRTMVEVDVSGIGTMSFNSEFVRVIFDEEQGFGEGWGKTRFGWYLGNYD